MSFNVIVRKYEHFNHAMGKYITSRAHYEKEMSLGGYVSFEKAEQMAKDTRDKQRKNYDGLSEGTMKFLHQVKDLADKKGNIKPTSKFVKGLEEHGVRFVDESVLPKHYQSGGFNGTSGK